MQTGFMGGWPSPTLARLTAADSPLPLSLSEASWVASLLNVGRLFGAVIGASLASLVGSKRTIFVTLWPLALGWLFVIVADSVNWLYASRLSLGAGLGMMYSAYPMYVGEVSVPEIRGALIAMSIVGTAFGKVISSTCGPYMSMSMAASIYFGLAVFLMFLFFWLPESPHHLVKVGNHKQAEKSINWYRNGQEVIKELKAVEKFVGYSSRLSFKKKCQEFKTKPIKKATLQIIILFTFMQICGLNSIVSYMETILRDSKLTIFNPASAVIYVNSSGIVASAISLVLIDRYGRKFLMVISSLGVCLSMLMLSYHFLLIRLGENVSDLQCLPIISMFLFIIAYFSGLMIVPNTILSEIFPINIKCIAACVGGITASVMSFLSAKTYQPMVDSIGESGVFLIHALCTFIAIPYTIFFMKETKGKTLSEIQNDEALDQKKETGVLLTNLT